ncbi:tyrosine-type recombinase/integrase [Campylobacter corcagiensis]|uniref:Site-specific integrase n=1 Tax=Campylobacter corcagiensis TaxID=1448857 RepID=A0A7M1LI89_9BACT|nr:site-specific integrase [Campylobacter corcagiensis]QKF64220.1 site-specific tyrosine recombinase, phage integrase family (INT_ICEBs1_C_like domain) [Campylobacter corcagiensis]QOQ87586.1 site-specific integrase [Campylobacter corcagiensis]
MDFSYYSNLYLKLGRKDWKNSTYEKNKGIVKNRLNVFNDMDIKEIKPSNLKLWLSSIDDVSGKSKKHYLNSLNMIFNLALEDEVISKNPVIHIKTPHHITPRIEPFIDDEVCEILQYSKKYNFNFQLFVHIGFYTGLRTGEILSLKIDEVDIKNKIISVNSTRSRFGESSPKTLKSIRKVPILEVLEPLLIKKLTTQKNQIYLLETQYKKPYRDSYIFLGFWTEILKNLGIKYRKPYNMRHTYATAMLKNGYVTPVKLASLMGHSSPKMIYDVYVNYLNSNLKEFNRKMDLY